MESERSEALRKAGKAKPSKPLKSHKKGTRRYDLHSLVQKTLGSGGDMRQAVKLPPGERYEEWLAVHVADFFNEVTLIYTIIEDDVTPEKFPAMTAGPRFEYFWADDANPKPRRVPAREYIDRLLSWAGSLISNEDFFVTDPKKSFPADFKSTAAKILRRMFRVYCHVFHHHWDKIEEVDAVPLTNSCLKHLLFFMQEFGLLPEKEAAPLQDFIDEMVAKEDAKSAKKAAPTAAGGGGGGGSGAEVGSAAGGGGGSGS